MEYRTKLNISIGQRPTSSPRSSTQLTFNNYKLFNGVENLSVFFYRTETNIFPKEFNLGQLVAMQTVDPQWGGK